MENNLIIENFNKNDYLKVAKLWKKQNWPIIPLNLLSTSGFVCKYDNEIILATWVYKTNSRIYMNEWTVGNPEISWKIRKNALNLLLDHVSFWSKKQGAEFLLTMTSNDRYIEKLKENNFNVTDTNITHLMRKL